MRTLTPLLLMLALLLILFALVPEPRDDCWLPVDAPTRGFYEDCWGFWEIWAAGEIEEIAQ